MQSQVFSRPPTPVPASLRDEVPPTFGQRAAEAVADLVGSWKFIVFQSCGILTWVVVNATGLVGPWDPYPFILMNLVLSLQAAYTAPMILMAQNRQAEKDRRILYGDYDLDANTNVVMRETLDRMKTLENKLVKEWIAQREVGDVLTKTLLRLKKIERKLNVEPLSSERVVPNVSGTSQKRRRGTSKGR